MIRKHNRADKKTLENVFKKGRSLRSASFNFKFLETHRIGVPRISVIAPKALARSAVERNTLRRRGYDALREHLGGFPQDLTAALILTRKNVSTEELRHELAQIAARIR